MLIIASVIAFTFPAVASADLNSCTCKQNSWSSNIIKLGDPASKVLRHCGEPDTIVEVGEVTNGRHRSRIVRRGKGYRVKGSYSEASTRVERWEYDMGSGKYPLLITISGGRVIRIKLERL
jgi:hypothetical protein